IAVDFSRPEGAALVRQMATRCDLLVENFKVGSLARYGLSYEDLAPLNPRLVYCSITGFGQHGPYAQRAGYDFLIQGMGGLMSITGIPDGQPGAGPQKVGVALTDLLTGMYAATGILAAVMESRATGQGQHLDVALLDVQIASLANQAMNYLVGGTAPGRLGNAHPNIVPYQDFRTRDGYLILAVGNDLQFRRFCQVCGQAAWADDPRAGDHARVRNLLERLYVRNVDTQFHMGKPTIAAVDGTARGGGMTLAVSCDMIVASESADFGYPEVDAGVPASIHFSHLPRIVGRHRAVAALFTGRVFDAHEAARLGLVSRLAPSGQAMAAARELAATLC